jgi:hypothetical protein
MVARFSEDHAARLEEVLWKASGCIQKRSIAFDMQSCTDKRLHLPRVFDRLSRTLSAENYASD